MNNLKGKVRIINGSHKGQIGFIDSTNVNAYMTTYNVSVNDSSEVIHVPHYFLEEIE